MRKLLVFTLIALFVCSYAFAARGDRTSPGVGDILGQGDLTTAPHKIFRLVRYVPAGGASTYVEATLAAESIVIWDTTSDDGVTVTTTTTSPDSAVAGIIVQNALTPDYGLLGGTAAGDIGRRNWTWLQTYGKCEVRIAGAVAAGNAMGTSGTAGEAESFIPSSSDASKQGNAGFFYDAGATTSDNIECFLVCD